MNQIFCHFLNKELSSFDAQNYIIDPTIGRKIRFQLFLTLYFATLFKDAKIAFEVFKESYCFSNNIYFQIQNSIFKFDLKLFLLDIQARGVNIPECMSTYEKDYFANLPKKFTIYRVMSKREYESKNFGISWTLEKKIAEQYIYFGDNNSEKGGLASKSVNKSDILTVFNNESGFEIIYLEDKRTNFSKHIKNCIYKLLNWKMKLALISKCAKITTGNTV